MVDSCPARVRFVTTLSKRRISLGQHHRSIVLATGVMAVTSLVVAYVLSGPIGLERVGLGWLTGQGIALLVIGVLVRFGRREHAEVNT